MAEGLIVVPLYFRQAPAELVAMMKDSTPVADLLRRCGAASGHSAGWPEAPPHFLFDEIFAGVEGVAARSSAGSRRRSRHHHLHLGTSGEAKGVVLTAANVGFMLGCTSARLDSLMGGRTGQDRIFHYLPFSFCASWIAVLTFMLRGSLVTLNTDLTKIPNDMPAVAPHYFLNVPQLLERMRRGVDEQIAQKGGDRAGNLFTRESGVGTQGSESRAPERPSGFGWRTHWFFPRSERKWSAEILRP